MPSSEIGSEFWDVPLRTDNLIFPETTQWYISGRGALKAVINALPDIRSVAMPSWCCDTMLKPFLEEGIEVRFYPVTIDPSFHQEPRLDCDALLIMDYFGFYAPALNLGTYPGIVIRDVTHSVFSRAYQDADYFFGSLRKWCGVWTGGYAWTKDGHSLPIAGGDKTGYASLRRQAMDEKYDYLFGASEEKKERTQAKRYLAVFEQAEDLLDHCASSAADPRDVICAQKLDVDSIRRQRRSNAQLLMDAFSDQVFIPSLDQEDCPLFVPILVPDGKRDELRQYLIQQEIYCPVHWPLTDYHQGIDQRSEYLYQNELSLVCDQRYTEADMLRMIHSIRRFWKER